jgi:WD40 repeat protein
MWRYGCLACLLLAVPIFGQDPPRLDDFGDPLPPGALRRFGTIRFRQDYVDEIAFLPDGKSLVAQGSGRVVQWDVATGKPLRSLANDSFAGRSPLGLGARGRLATVRDTKGDIVVVDLESGKEHFRVTVDGKKPGGIVSPDGSLLAIGTEQGLSLWDLKTGKERPSVPQDCIENLRFSPDGETLVVQGRFVLMVDPKTGETRVQTKVDWKDLHDRALALQFSTDQKSLVVCTGASGIQTFDLTTGKPHISQSGPRRLAR